MKHTSKRRVIPTIAVLTSLSLLAASCGDDDNKDSGASTTAPAPASSAQPTSSSGEPGAADAATLLKELTTRPTKITQTEEITGEVPKGKQVIWIQCSVPACIALGKPFEEATKALGWTLKTISHNGTPEGVKNAYAQAVREAPDAVVSSGYPRVMFETELAELKAKNIPVIQLNVSDDPGDAITSVVDGRKRVKDIGEQQAIFVAADSGGAGNVLWVTSTFPILQPQFDGVDGEGGFKPTLEELCKDCKVDTLEIPIDALATGAPQRVVAHLQANPDINYVMCAFADLITPLPGALADAGLAGKVKVAGYAQNESISTAVAQGKVAAVVGYPGPEDMWQIADQLMRIFMGLPFEADYSDLPSWIITKDAVPSTTEYYPLVADYQAQYKALWGVS